MPDDAAGPDDAGAWGGYVYSFVAWPDETWGFDRAVFDLFNVLAARVEMPFTEREFEAFRSRLSHHGLTLREVERRRDTPREAVR